MLLLLLFLLLPFVGCQFLVSFAVFGCQEKVNSLAVSQKEVNAEFKGSLHKELGAAVGAWADFARAPLAPSICEFPGMGPRGPKGLKQQALQGLRNVLFSQH